MPKTSNGETPYSLVYGTEAVIPVELGDPTSRLLHPEENNQALRMNLDLLEERREVATIREAKYKAKMEKFYNNRVREQVLNKEIMFGGAMRCVKPSLQESWGPGGKVLTSFVR